MNYSWFILEQVLRGYILGTTFSNARRITVTSSLNEISTDQLGNRVVVRDSTITPPAPESIEWFVKTGLSRCRTIWLPLLSPVSFFGDKEKEKESKKERKRKRDNLPTRESLVLYKPFNTLWPAPAPFYSRLLDWYSKTTWTVFLHLFL